MGLFKKFMNQTRKPEGFLGRARIAAELPFEGGAPFTA